MQIVHIELRSYLVHNVSLLFISPSLFTLPSTIVEHHQHWPAYKEVVTFFLFVDQEGQSNGLFTKRASASTAINTQRARDEQAKWPLWWKVFWGRLLMQGRAVLEYFRGPARRSYCWREHSTKEHPTEEHLERFKRASLELCVQSRLFSICLYSTRIREHLSASNWLLVSLWGGCTNISTSGLIWYRYDSFSSGRLALTKGAGVKIQV